MTKHTDGKVNDFFIVDFSFFSIIFSLLPELSFKAASYMRTKEFWEKDLFMSYSSQV